MLIHLKQRVYKAFPNLSSKYHAYKRLISNENSYIYETGWIHCLLAQAPCDPSGAEIPWMNYALISFLEERLTNDMRVLEFGSGQSTIYFSKRVKSVSAVEYNPEWYKKVKNNSLKNVELTLMAADKDGDYCRFGHGHKFDLIVIDGRDRVNCCIQAVEKLTVQGVVLLDDSHRGRYLEAFEKMRNCGFKELSFSGLKPHGTAIDRTTIFYREKNCLGI